MKTLYIVEGDKMKDEFIVFAVSSQGVERVKLFHTGKKKSIGQVLELYQRISPDLQRLESKIRRNCCGGKETRDKGHCESLGLKTDELFEELENEHPSCRNPSS
jgi:hypothetical protein